MQKLRVAKLRILPFAAIWCIVKDVAGLATKYAAVYREKSDQNIIRHEQIARRQSCLAKAFTKIKNRKFRDSSAHSQSQVRVANRLLPRYRRSRIQALPSASKWLPEVLKARFAPYSHHAVKLHSFLAYLAAYSTNSQPGPFVSTSSPKALIARPFGQI